MKIYRYEGKSPLDQPVVILMTDGNIVHAEVGPLAGRAREQRVTVWAEVAESPPSLLVQRTFQVYGTGHSFGYRSAHVLTWREGGYVWHLRELL